MTAAGRCGAARRESVRITFEDVVRLALRRACLVSRFHPLNLERILWLRKRRRRKRRRRRRRRRRPRSNLQARVEPQLRPGTRFELKIVLSIGGPRARLLILAVVAAPSCHCERSEAIHLLV